MNAKGVVHETSIATGIRRAVVHGLLFAQRPRFNRGPCHFRCRIQRRRREHQRSSCVIGKSPSFKVETTVSFNNASRASRDFLSRARRPPRRNWRWVVAYNKEPNCTKAATSLYCKKSSFKDPATCFTAWYRATLQTRLNDNLKSETLVESTRDQARSTSLREHLSCQSEREVVCLTGDGLWMIQLRPACHREQTCLVRMRRRKVCLVGGDTLVQNSFLGTQRRIP